jgi:hypothetical protein
LKGFEVNEHDDNHWSAITNSIFMPMSTEENLVHLPEFVKKWKGWRKTEDGWIRDPVYPALSLQADAATVSGMVAGELEQLIASSIACEETDNGCEFQDFTDIPYAEDQHENTEKDLRSMNYLYTAQGLVVTTDGRGELEDWCLISSTSATCSTESCLEDLRSTSDRI